MNSLTIIGNVGREPEMTYTPSGLAVAKFTIADNLPKAKGAEKPETQWFNCTAFGKTAETITQYVKKGSKLYILGKFHARPWTGKDGIDHISLDVTVDNFQLLDGKPANGAPAPAADAPATDEGESFPF
jgi:single-strand DNA-binding protein